MENKELEAEISACNRVCTINVVTGFGKKNMGK